MVLSAYSGQTAVEPMEIFLTNRDAWLVVKELKWVLGAEGEWSGQI